jgi:hypothetical protein
MSGAMTLGLLPSTLAPVRKGTVIKLTAEELSADPKDIANTRIKAVYRAKEYRPGFSPTVGPTQSLRQRILMCSLFPNIFNANYQFRSSGTMAVQGPTP